MKQTALNELIEIFKQKRKESEISNTLLKFVHDEAIRLLETEKKQQDEYAIEVLEFYHNSLFMIPLKDGEAKRILKNIKEQL